MIWSRSLPLLFLVVCSEATFWRLLSVDNCTLDNKDLILCNRAINEVKLAQKFEQGLSSACEQLNKDCNNEAKNCLSEENDLQITVEACGKNQTEPETNETGPDTQGPREVPPAETSKNETAIPSTGSNSTDPKEEILPPGANTTNTTTPSTTTTTTTTPTTPSTTTPAATPAPSVTVTQPATDLPTVTPGYSADCNSRIKAARQEENVKILNLALLSVRTPLGQVFHEWKLCRVLNWEKDVKEGLQVIEQYCSPQEAEEQRQEVINARTKFHCDKYGTASY